jgi:putative ABC transport system substrate-binding protein
MGSDPVKAGVVASLNRPEGNVTGVSFLINSLGTKRAELISQLVPTASTIGMLASPNNPDAEIETRDAQAAAQALGRKLLIVKSSPGSDLEVAFATLIEGVDALAVSGDLFFEAHRDQLIALAARHMMPAIYVLREDPAAGGLMSYGTSISGAFRQGGVYVGSILKGTKPSDLPVIQSTKFELVINLKTAKALSLDVPPTLLAVADEVIE